MTAATRTPPALPAAPAHSAADPRKVAHFLRNIKLIMVSYVVDGIALLLFHAAGTIGWLPAILYTGSGLLLWGNAYWLIVSGRTRHLKDPSIAVPQMVLTQSQQLAAMALFPEVNFVFALVLFVVYCTFTLTAAVSQSIVAWVLASVGTIVVLGLADTPIQIPDRTLAEQWISYGFFVITLWRCMWLGAFNGSMTSQLRMRGKELWALTAKVDELAHRDELTGVMNRRSVLSALTEELKRAERSSHPVCVGMMDIDHFKSINDRHGHLAGDRTLKIFASSIAAVTRRADRFGRYGGEEFLLVMSGTAEDAAHVPIERMRTVLQAADWRSIAPDLQVTFSCGITQYRPGESVEALLQRADDALYRAKADGRNCSRKG